MPEIETGQNTSFYVKGMNNHLRNDQEGFSWDSEDTFWIKKIPKQGQLASRKYLLAKMEFEDFIFSKEDMMLTNIEGGDELQKKRNSVKL